MLTEAEVVPKPFTGKVIAASRPTAANAGGTGGKAFAAFDEDLPTAVPLEAEEVEEEAVLPETDAALAAEEEPLVEDCGLVAASTGKPETITVAATSNPATARPTWIPIAFTSRRRS